MKAVLATIAVATLAFVLPVQAQDRVGSGAGAPPAAVGEPAQIIYRVTGVNDSGANNNAGTATSVHCTNFSGTSETLRFVVRNFNSVVLGDLSSNVGSLRTITASTHLTAAFFEDLTLSAGIAINQGTIAISATSLAIVCTAMMVDAAATTPIGIALHMMRFNPLPGTAE